MADSYSYDMQRLQQDAIRRAREMQSRAQSIPAPPHAPPQAPPDANSVQNHQGVKPTSSPPSEQVKRMPTPNQPMHSPPLEQFLPAQEMSKKPNPITDIFESLMSDSERTLILLLILLLVEEKSDPGVIFALMYLIL